MKKTMSGLVAAVMLAATLSLAAAVPSSAADAIVTITRTGFVPRNVTINVGDQVTWTNADTVAHQVVVSGVTCNVTVQPAQQAACVFNRAGRFAFREPSRQGGAWRGAVTVRAGPLSVTITAAPATVTYGAATTLSGRVSNGQANERVTAQAQLCGATSFSTLGTATTTAGGNWTFATRPTKNATYRARWRTATSAAPAVKVRPRMSLRKLTRSRFSLRVFAAQSFSGRVAVFQRYATARGTWVRVRFVVLRAGGTTTLPLNPSTVSRSTFRARVRAGTRVRAVLGQTQAGACYVAGRSNVVRR
jgi:plastocyanin